LAYQSGAKASGSNERLQLWSSEKPIRPEPYPSSPSAADWDEFLADLFNQWAGTGQNLSIEIKC
jgi:hypothetical protein